METQEITSSYSNFLFSHLIIINTNLSLFLWLWDLFININSLKVSIEKDWQGRLGQWV